MRQAMLSARNYDICAARMTTIRQTWQRPFIEKICKETYTVNIVRCPLCGNRLASYKSGSGWCENGLHQSELKNCPCGQKIDYRGVPNVQ